MSVFSRICAGARVAARHTALLACAATLLGPVAAQTTVPGEIPGEFAVSPSGAATNCTPISTSHAYQEARLSRTPMCWAFVIKNQLLFSNFAQ